MLEFSEAQRRVLAAARRLDTEKLPVAEVAGRVLAEALHSVAPLPAFDYSAMDGYAVRCADFSEVGPWDSQVAAETRAGEPPRTLVPGTCIRIFTGAPLPSGADAIVIQEDAERTEERVRFRAQPKANAHIRRAGEDLAAGAVAIPSGTRLNPFHLGLIAGLDRSHVNVSKAPRVIIAPTGDELRPPGSAPRPGSIPESNGIVIAELARQAGAQVELVDVLRDDREATTQRLAALLPRCDVLVTIGGVSVGDHDVVRDALVAAGAELEFWKIAIRPGKPFTLGRAGATRVLGLPGNPASAQVTFALLGMPLIRAMQGDVYPLPPVQRVKLAEAWSQKSGRLGIHRATLRAGRAYLEQRGSSGSVLSLARADALVFVPANVEHCAEGTELDAVELRDL